MAAERPDLVLMDWFLPDGNGLDIIKRVRRRGDAPQPRLVMLTANAMEESRQAALRAGADDFLSKPFEEGELYAVLEKHLGLRFVRGAARASSHALPRAGAPCGVTAVVLAGLGAETRALLAQAALSLNPEQIAAALRVVARENPALAECLGEFASARQYQALWQVLGILEAEE